MLLDEIGYLLDPGSSYGYAAVSSGLWVGYSTTPTGYTFEASSGYAMVSTESDGLAMNLDNAMLRNFGSVTGGNSTWRLFKGLMPDSTSIGDRAVAIMAAGGRAQIPNLKIDRNTVAIRVRGARADQLSTAYEDAKLKVDEIKETLHAVFGSTQSGNTYYSIQATRAASFTGMDASLRPEFDMEFSVFRQSTSTT